MSEVHPSDPDDEAPAAPPPGTFPPPDYPKPAVGPYDAWPPPPPAPAPPPPPAPYAAYPPPMPPGVSSPYSAPVLPPYNGKAIASLALGASALGLLVLLACLWFVAPVVAVLAVVFGHLALRELRVDGRRGRGLAIAGLVTGYLAIALTVLGLVALAFLVAASSAPTPG